MKFQVTMKDPDTLFDAIQDAVAETLETMPEDEAEAVREIRENKAHEVASEWFKYGEYLTVEIDTEEKTIRVVPESEQE